MPPRIILIRHAQALHNDYSIPDPPLSELGVEQCAALREKLISEYSSVATDSVAIIASPMRRTLQTTMLSLDWLVDRGVKVEGNADWQENSDKPCDTGSSVASLTGDFTKVDFGTVDAVWLDKMSPAGRRYAYSRNAILARGRRVIEDLYKRPEKLVFVVSHSGFLRLSVTGWWFYNSDYRIFDFEGQPGTLELKLDESTISGGMGLSWTMQVELGSELPDEPEENPAKEVQ